MVCGLCGGRLGHGTNNWKSSYRCPQCHRCHVIAADAEEDIAGRVLARIDQVRLGELAVAGTAASADEEALALLEAKADELVDMLGAGDLDRAEYRRARERLEGRTEVVKSRIRRDLEVERRRGLVGGAMQLASTWDEMSTDDKREIIKVFVDHITLRSAVRGRNTYDPSRLVVTWV
jgi:plasmid stabilization system protein ParE